MNNSGFNCVKNLNQATYFSDEGNQFKSLQVIEHFLHKTIVWFHENWGSFQNECSVTTTTISSNPTTLDDSSNPAENGTYYPLSANYLTAACILFGMHIFTLTVWAHLKI